MKTTSAALRTHLNQAVTTLATCWLITRTDGAVFAFTSHDQDLVVSGVTYKSAAGFSRSAIASDATMGVDNLDVVGYFDDSAIKETELRAGLFDYAAVNIFIVNWADLTQGIMKLRRGWLGEAALTKQGIYRCELRGLSQALSQTIGEVYTPGCRADLGDAKCGVPIAPILMLRNTAYIASSNLTGLGAFAALHVPDPTISASDSTVYRDKMFVCSTAGTTAAVAPLYDYTPGHTTADGTAVFTCLEAWTRCAVITAVDVDGVSLDVSFPYPDPRMVDNWFAWGLAIWESGPNLGAACEIKASLVANNAVQLFVRPRFAAAVGDKITVSVGCNHSILGDCVAKFGNAVNFRGEPFVPGVDAMLLYPDADGIGPFTPPPGPHA